MKSIRCGVLAVLLMIVSFCTASCGSQGIEATGIIETNSSETTMTESTEKVEFPEISEEMLLTMPEIKSDIRIKMGASFTSDFEHEVDTFMAILKTAHDNCLSDGDISRYIRVADLANSKYEYLIEEIDDTIGMSNVDSINFLLSRGRLTSLSTLVVLSSIDETEAFEHWDFLKELIREYSMFFYDTDILS